MCLNDKKQSSSGTTAATDKDTSKPLSIVETVPRTTVRGALGSRKDKASYVTLSDGSKVYSETGSALNTSEEVSQATERANEIIAARQSEIDAAAGSSEKQEDTSSADTDATDDSKAIQNAIDAASKINADKITKLEEELAASILSGETSSALGTEKIQSLETQILDLKKANAETLGQYTAAAAAGIGNTGVTVQKIVETKPDAAMLEQERLAAAELRKQRIERARSKQSLLKRREERIQEVGSGRKVLSGEEMDLGLKYRDSLISASTGKRMGSGRRSLLTGSTGGIGYYSRFV